MEVTLVIGLVTDVWLGGFNSVENACRLNSTELYLLHWEYDLGKLQHQHFYAQIVPL